MTEINSPKKPPRTDPRRDDFPHLITDTLRYGDEDRQGHVNNAVYATFFESGRVHLFRHPDVGLPPPDGSVVLAKIEINYLRELHWPGAIETGTGILRLGTSSLTLAQAVFKDGACYAAGLATVVLIDKATRRPSPIPPALAERLAAFKMRDVAAV